MRHFRIIRITLLALLALCLPLTSQVFAGQFLIFKGRSVTNGCLDALVAVPAGGLVNTQPLYFACLAIPYQDGETLVYSEITQQCQAFIDFIDTTSANIEHAFIQDTGRSGSLEQLTAEIYSAEEDAVIWFESTMSQISIADSATCATTGRGTPNLAPVARNLTFVISEDNGILFNLDAVDPDGDILTYSVSNPRNGSLSGTAPGLLYTPHPDFHGTDSFTYRANDGLADSNLATVTIVVNPVNDVPTASQDAYATDEDTTLTVPAPGVLANDTDVDGDSLAAVLVAGPANGTLALNASGAFTYTPNTNFNGTDSFTYAANDSVLGSNIAAVTITVNPVNDSPVAVDDTYTTDEDIALTVPAPGVLVNDSDVDGDPLAVTLALVTGPANGTLTLNVDGSFTYVPKANFNGEDRFTYIANDGLAKSNEATVLIKVRPVNDVPTASQDAYATDEDTTLTVPAPGVLANDTDVDGDSLAAVLVAGPANGTLALNASGAFTYTPNTNFNGTDSFTYAANDSVLGSNIAAVTITVNPVNDSPVAVDDTYTTDEDIALTVPAPGVLVNDSDVDGDPLAVTLALVTGPANGTLTLNADGSFTYVPKANFNGEDRFTYIANDGLAKSNEATVLIKVRPVNDVPVARDDAYSTDEDTQLSVLAPGILDKDTDVDGDPLTAVLATGPANGSLALSANGSFTYTPNVNFNGTDSFTYRANDGLAGSNPATVTITVNPVNDLPTVIANDPTVSVSEGQTATNSGSYADIDGDGVSISASIGTVIQTETAGVGSWSWSYASTDGPDQSQTVTITATDSAGAVSTTTFLLTVNNVAPTVAADSLSVTVNESQTAQNTGTFADPGNDIVGITSSTGTVAQVGGQAGTWSWSFGTADGPDQSQIVTITATDSDGAFSTTTFDLIVLNAPPVADDDSYSTPEDTVLNVSAPGVLDGDHDAGADMLGATIATPPGHGLLILNLDGSFVYTPDVNFNGSDGFTYTVTDDDGATDTGTVSITVDPVNDVPSVNNDRNSQAIQYSDAILPVTVSASDIDSSNLSFSSSWRKDGGADQAGLPGNLALSSIGCSGVPVLSCSTTLSGAVDGGAGTYAITVIADDGQLSAITVVTLVVSPEDATIKFDDGNPVAVRVASDEGVSGDIMLAVHVSETTPDLSAGTPLPGDINKANILMTLDPVGPGAQVSGSCLPAPARGSDYSAVLTVTCNFFGVEVNTYAVTVTVNGGYYRGGAEDVLVVFDPSLGFSTGGGWFYWPGSENLLTGYPGDKVNFGFNMKYNKRMTNMQGSLLLIRHLADGTNYRIKSNALYGLALADVMTGSYGWASFSGKATYRLPGSDTPEGNHEFVAYVEDHNEPGTGNDRFWIELKDKARIVVDAMSMQRSAGEHAVDISGGNVVVPHSSTGMN